METYKIMKAYKKLDLLRFHERVDQLRPLSINEPNSSPDPFSRVPRRLRTVNNHRIKKPPIRPIIREPNREEEDNWTEDEKIAADGLLMMANQSQSPRKKVKRENVYQRADHDAWPITKELTATDLTKHHNRVLLKRQLGYDHVIALLDERSRAKVCSSDGWKVKVKDVDTDQVYDDLIFKWYESCRGYIFRSGWHDSFVVKRKLKEGDKIGMIWSPVDNMFFFTVLERANKLSSSGSKALVING